MQGSYVSADTPPHISLKIGWLFLFAVLMAAGLLFTMVFFVCAALGFHWVHLAVVLNADVQLRPLLIQIIMFSDLECDYINPIDLCNKLNQVPIQAGFFSFSLLTRYSWRSLSISATSVCVT
jgi:hypothetical protein